MKKGKKKKLRKSQDYQSILMIIIFFLLGIILIVSLRILMTGLVVQQPQPYGLGVYGLQEFPGVSPVRDDPIQQPVGQTELPRQEAQPTPTKTPLPQFGRTVVVSQEPVLILLALEEEIELKFDAILLSIEIIEEEGQLTVLTSSGNYPILPDITQLKVDNIIFFLGLEKRDGAILYLYLGTEEGAVREKINPSISTESTERIQGNSSGYYGAIIIFIILLITALAAFILFWRRRTSSYQNASMI